MGDKVTHQQIKFYFCTISPTVVGWGEKYKERKKARKHTAVRLSAENCSKFNRLFAELG
jgi:hypothetical protein